MHVKDQLNRELVLNGVPKRIISLVPSQTELLVDLGLEEQLVGITKFCVHPRSLRKSKTIVGGTKSVHIDRIAALSPDIIICNKEENTPEIVAALEPIAPVWISDVECYAQALELLTSMGMIFKKETIATTLVQTIENKRIAFENAIKNKPIKKVGYLIWKEPYMAVGTATYIDDIMKLNKFQNVFGPKEERYPEVALEELQLADLILLSTEPYPFKQNDVDDMRQKLGLDVQLVDGGFFSWYGSRMVKAFDYFRSLQI
jgi:ABC-type Fe3+-hydroxamate transport system substrate-binding protein